MSRWTPVTLQDEVPEPAIEFVLTPHERDMAVLARLDLIAQRQRAAVIPHPGLEVKEISMDEWLAAGGRL